jgi:hypothetical protein
MTRTRYPAKRLRDCSFEEARHRGWIYNDIKLKILRRSDVRWRTFCRTELGMSMCEVDKFIMIVNSAHPWQEFRRNKR